MSRLDELRGEAQGGWWGAGSLLCAVLVFDTEQCPHASTADFGESDDEGEDGGVLQIVDVNGVKDPVEA